ncbi:sensor histidine kinase [Krasilnikoviella flava]|uniref:histidine kinase n=1 Tax=Krasilnikoviella flava TaxID=526729 RepID=A0A1T5KVH1_9MICO|nr:ATP-binding protein [Krasilnikoviella flava]SKC67792.1 Signal transduction histidine kinase [Krasilnikoviella flava]
MAQSGAARWLPVLLVAAQVVVGALAWQSRSWILLAFGELALLVGGTALYGVVRYRDLRDRYRREREVARRLAERRQLADEVHDLVGHELSVIGMRAALLQLRTTGDESVLAGQVRSDAERAVVMLHETVATLHRTPWTDPAEADVAAVIERFRRAGADVHLVGDPDVLTRASVATRVTAHRVVLEALTNSARHAPGDAVTVVVRRADDVVTLEVRTHGSGDPSPAVDRDDRRGGGLESLRRRVQAIGGTWQVDTGADGHRVVARLPVRATLEPEPEVASGAAPETSRARRPFVALVGPLVLPAVLVLLGGAAYWAWASHDATVEPVDAVAVRVGMPAAEAAEHLPVREAPVRLARAPGPGPGWECRQYTDGNVPLAMATLEVCTDGGTVVRVTDLSEMPLL